MSDTEDQPMSCVPSAHPKLLLRRRDKGNGSYNYVGSTHVSLEPIPTWEMPVWLAEALMGPFHGLPNPNQKQVKIRMGVAQGDGCS